MSWCIVAATDGSYLAYCPLKNEPVQYIQCSRFKKHDKRRANFCHIWCLLQQKGAASRQVLYVNIVVKDFLLVTGAGAISYSYHIIYKYNILCNFYFSWDLALINTYQFDIEAQASVQQHATLLAHALLGALLSCCICHEPWGNNLSALRKMYLKIRRRCGLACDGCDLQSMQSL